MLAEGLLHTPAFEDRHEAGRLLANMVRHLREEHPVVLALPRGGVPLGYEVARVLSAPLDLLLVRKLPVPRHPDITMGVIGESGAIRLNGDVVRAQRVSPGDLDEIVLHEREELERQAWRYALGRPRLSVEGRVVLLVDDGIATGETARFAVETLRKERPARVLLGAGVVSPEAYPTLFRTTDGVYSPMVPGIFHSIAEWYRQFAPVSEAEVERLLQEVHHMHDEDALPSASG